MLSPRVCDLIAREAILDKLLREHDFGHINNRKTIEKLHQEIIDELTNEHGLKSISIDDQE
jgi:hypothetical protein